MLHFKISNVRDISRKLISENDARPFLLRRPHAMQDEIPYEPLPPAHRVEAEPEFTRPIGAWIIVGALCVVTVALWALVASFFTLHA